MLQLEIVPGKGTTDFLLGMPISQAIAIIQKEKKTIPHVDLYYNEKDPLVGDIILDLIEDGVVLRFESNSQRLKKIEIYDVKKLQLTYSGSIFSRPDKPSTLVSTIQTFGPTHPGEFDSKTQQYLLQYPGLAFSFIIPEKYDSLYKNSNEIPPSEFPDGTTPLTNCISVFHGSHPSQIEVPKLIDSYYFEEIKVLPKYGVEFIARKCIINFQSTAQDVLSLLGPPSAVFEKEEDKMKIHARAYAGLNCADYFYNYFFLGVDFLFDVRSNVVKKIVLHTNIPGHHEFNQYVKANFKLYFPEIEEKFFVHPNMRWAEIHKRMPSSEKPVVNSQGSYINPFGPTLFYGYDNYRLIFEVIQKNNYIATVCLFS